MGEEAGFFILEFWAMNGHDFWILKTAQHPRRTSASPSDDAYTGGGCKFATYTRPMLKVETVLDPEPSRIQAAPQTHIRVTMLTAASEE